MKCIGAIKLYMMMIEWDKGNDQQRKNRREQIRDERKKAKFVNGHKLPGSLWKWCMRGHENFDHHLITPLHVLSPASPLAKACKVMKLKKNVNISPILSHKPYITYPNSNYFIAWVVIPQNSNFYCFWALIWCKVWFNIIPNHCE